MKIERFIEIRKDLHQHPEVSGNETKTAAKISELLLEINPKFQLEKLADNSLIASIGNINGKGLAFRCELDALPIQEENAFQHQSKTEGVSHKCGHDGHMAIMLCLANKLKDVNLDQLYVSLIFQAAEENGKGAKYVIENSTLFNKNKPTSIFSLHNLPGFAENEIIVKDGVFTPEVRSVKFCLKGKTAHASEPHNGFNPAYMLAELIEITEAQINEDASSADFNLITPIYAHLGEESYGVAPGYAELGFTLRSWSKTLALQTKDWIEDTAEKLGENHSVEVTYEWFDEFGSVDNNSQCCQIIKAAASKLNLTVVERSEPMPFGEDFGLFTSATKGAMFGVGSGLDSPALHNPDFDFNDALIEPASSLFLEILNQVNYG